MSEKSKRPIEVYCLWPDQTWNSNIVEIPADTPEDQIEAVAKEYGERQFGPDCVCWVYNTMDDECPDMPRQYRCAVILHFLLDQVTVGSEKEQEAAAIDRVNMLLQREPYGLGARLEKARVVDM